ncbi:MAG: FG-GAP-like repeat-containing protein [Gallionella sp.]
MTKNFIGVCTIQSAICTVLRSIARVSTPAVRATAVLTAAASLLIGSPAQATFFTPGKFDVTPSGAANYTVPIAVPPGTAGMAPSLALSYNSQGGNGLFGMGWSLSGLSAITRCPKTLIQDGVKSGVTYTATDSLCLDGQRLVAIAGTYGASGTEYRTEGESFSKIVSYGASGSPVSGPGYFKVWTKSGQVMEFGNTTDSAVEKQGPAATAASRPIRVWSVNKISDSKGNYLIVKYAKETVTWGSYIPTTILYTGNTAAGLLPYSHVDFHPVTRTDTPIGYDAGSSMSTPWLIDHIYTYTVVKGVDTLVKDYRLTYDVSSATKRSRVTQLQECDGLAATAICLQPTKLGWQGAAGSFAPQQSWGGHGGGTTNNFLGDFNGDGKMDIMAWAGIPSYWVVSISTGTSFAPQQSWGGHGGGTANNFLGDFNGDGKMDIMAWAGAPTYWVVSLSTGTGFAPQQSWGGHGGGTTNNFLGDFNGDGKTDIMAWAGAPYNWVVSLSTGTGFTPQQVWGGHGGTMTNNFLGDFNGDGKMDIMAWAGAPTYWVVSLSTGTGFAPQQSWGGHGGGTTNNFLGDFNGDGKTDIMAWAGAPYNWVVSLSTGTGFTPQQVWGGHGGTMANNFLSDFNGDGKTDIMAWAGAPYNWVVSLSSGTGFTPQQVWGGHGGTTANNFLGDFNGDGKTDIMAWAGVPTYWVVNPSVISGTNKIEFPDLLISVTNGLGATTSNSYKPLTDSTVYSKDSGAVYPLMDIQAPMYVVSSVSSSNGIGSNYTSNYNYVGAKSHLTGGGFLGFRQTVNTDAQTQIVSTTTYRQDYPYQGLPLTAQKRTSTGVVLNNVSNRWTSSGNAAWSAQYHAPQLTQSVETSYELTGGLISTVTTGTTYDVYGNPTVITVSTPDGYSKTTTNTYVNDTVNWYLGRLTNATVSSTKP